MNTQREYVFVLLPVAGHNKITASFMAMNYDDAYQMCRQEYPIEDYIFYDCNVKEK